MMRFYCRKIQKKGKFRQLFVLTMATFAFFTSFNLYAEPLIESGNNTQTSVGTPMDGSLTLGEVLPKRGAGYRLITQAKSRRARFGISELIALIKEAGFRVSRQYRGSVLKVADLSRRLGGPMEHHGSHQNGRDVDLLFYLTDMKGRTTSSEAFIPIDTNGYSTEPPMKYRFHTPKNWALVKTLLSSKKAVVQWIFVSENIKKLLLNYADESGESKTLVNKAKQVLRQPGPKTHVDHFHVRIYCPPSHKPSCRDIGPRWAWARAPRNNVPAGN
jgi:penicillin-insensitive murein endopeptidase